MQSKLTVCLFLAACVSSCLAECKPEPGGTAESYLCDNISNLQADLATVPVLAQRITILDSELSSLPKNSFARFGTSLVYLNITNSKVASIEAGAFAGLGKLRVLVIAFNEIKLINADWIKDLKSLKELWVWHNQITAIEPEVFEHLPHLEILDIANNNIKNCIGKELLAKLAKLQTIFLTRNPWPLKCRPDVIFHLDHKHVKTIHTWGDTHILVAECLAHDPYTRFNEEALETCVSSIHLSPLSSPLG